MGLALQSLPESPEAWLKTESERALEMFNSGKSYMEIAHEFKRTKNSIAGLISRYRKKNMVLPPADRPRRVKKAVALKKDDPVALAITQPQFKAKPHRIRLRLIVNQAEVTFAELEPFHCRYPFGDPKLPDFRFCGKFKCDGSAYCKDHCALVYAPKPIRNRR